MDLGNLSPSQKEFVCQQLAQSIIKYHPRKCPPQYAHFHNGLVGGAAEWHWQRMIGQEIGTLQDCLKGMT